MINECNGISPGYLLRFQVYSKCKWLTIVYMLLSFNQGRSQSSLQGRASHFQKLKTRTTLVYYFKSKFRGFLATLYADLKLNTSMLTKTNKYFISQ